VLVAVIFSILMVVMGNNFLASDQELTSKIQSFSGQI